MKFTLISCKPVTIDDLRTEEDFQNLTDQEAETLLKQIQEFSNLIYQFVTKQEDE